MQHLDGVDFKTACMTLVGEPPPKANGWDCTSEPKKLLAAEFRYENEGGAVLFVVERLEYQDADGSFVVTERGKRKKTFRQKRPVTCFVPIAIVSTAEVRRDQPQARQLCREGDRRGDHGDPLDHDHGDRDGDLIVPEVGRRRRN